MNRTSSYYKQVQLLIQIIPIIAEEDCFALKGGTAINLFEKNLPRLSVDIDLVFLPIRERKGSLAEISTALSRIAKRIRETWSEISVVEDNGLDEELRKAFIVYLISHPRPIAELLQPGLKDISAIYHGEFKHMTENLVSKSKLEEALRQLIEIVNSSLTENERKFLLSFKQKKPCWDLLGLPKVEELPAVKWKQQNLEKMPAEKHEAAWRKLESAGGKAISKLLAVCPIR